MRDEIIHLHVSLATKIKNIQMEVDKSLVQFFTRKVPWSPTLQVHRDYINYWYWVLCIETRVFTSKNAIKKLSIKLGEYSVHYLTSLACLDKLKIAWNEYHAGKKEAWSLWQTFLEEKIARKPHDRNVTTENILKMLKREQWSIQEGADLRQIRERNKK